ncbi:MAG: glutathione S-transferase family protein [Verrucomicrobia bacterium]|nr:glutathione S-transferase family protein [Verrucomicrobiota bacterium]
MLELIQIPWCTFCLVQRRILDFSGAPHRLVDIPPSDRSLVWRRTRQRYYQVPVLRHGRSVIFETDEHSQVIAKYLESQLQLGLFPAPFDGLQKIVWRHIESEIEPVAAKLNDAYYLEVVPPVERLGYLQFKERKFGRGCLRQWLQQQNALAAELAEKLIPFEQMLRDRPFLLDQQPRFVDFDLWGVLAGFLYSGHYKLPADHRRVKRWYRRLGNLTFSAIQRPRTSAARSRLGV